MLGTLRVSQSDAAGPTAECALKLIRTFAKANGRVVAGRIGANGAACRTRSGGRWPTSGPGTSPSSKQSGPRAPTRPVCSGRG